MPSGNGWCLRTPAIAAPMSAEKSASATFLATKVILFYSSGRPIVSVTTAAQGSMPRPMSAPDRRATAAALTHPSSQQPIEAEHLSLSLKEIGFEESSSAPYRRTN
jgi:hypothetical protein